MSELKIYLDGYLDVPKERWGEVIAALPEHISLTGAEDGCISFDVVPSQDIPNRLVVSEVFKNRTAFERHQDRASQTVWAEVIKGIPRNYDIKEDS